MPRAKPAAGRPPRPAKHHRPPPSPVPPLLRGAGDPIGWRLRSPNPAWPGPAARPRSARRPGHRQPHPPGPRPRAVRRAGERPHILERRPRGQLGGAPRGNRGAPERNRGPVPRPHGFRLTPTAPDGARQRRYKSEGGAWGAYYQSDPCVLAGSIEAAAEPLDHFADQAPVIPWSYGETWWLVADGLRGLGNLTVGLVDFGLVGKLTDEDPHEDPHPRRRGAEGRRDPCCGRRPARYLEGWAGRRPAGAGRAGRGAAVVRRHRRPRRARRTRRSTNKPSPRSAATRCSSTPARSRSTLITCRRISTWR